MSKRISVFLESVHNPKRHSATIIWLLLVFLLVPITLIAPEFFRPANISNVMVQMVPLGIAAIGQTLVILGGGIDLSIGACISLITIVASTTMRDGIGSILGTIILCLFLGFAFGSVNGLILKIFRISPLITTLCTSYLLQGTAFALHRTSGGYIPVLFKKVITASNGMLSVPFALFLVCMFIGVFVQKRTRFGRYVYALGGNEDVLANTGVKPDNIRFATYAISGLLSAVVGLYIAARLKSGSAHYGEEYTLLSVTATVVGGTSMAGGLGGLSGTFAGSILVSMLNNLLNNIGFKYGFQSAYYKEIITGLILVGSMFFYQKREKV